MRIPAEHYPEKAIDYSKKWAFDHSAEIYAVRAIMEWTPTLS